MNVFDTISDRLAALSCRKPLRMHTACSCKATAEHHSPIEVFTREDVLEILCDVEEEYNIAMKKDHPWLFDPSWCESIAEKCAAGQGFSVSGSAEFIEMAREIASSYGYSMYEWGISEHHARLAPPTEEIEDRDT